MSTPQDGQEMRHTPDLRQINIQVAAQVMGWTQWVDLSADCPDEPEVTHFADWGDSHGAAVYLAGDQSGDPAFYFNPAEDISDAWRVFEKMVELGHIFIVKGDGLRAGDFSPRWTVLCDNLPRVDSDSAPLAICLASLAAATSSPQEAQ